MRNNRKIKILIGAAAIIIFSSISLLLIEDIRQSRNCPRIQ